MNDRPPRPPDTPWLTPYLTVRDMQVSLDFYAKAFGFETEFTLPGPDGAVVHASMRYKDEMVIMLGPEGAMGSPALAPVTTGTHEPIGLYLYCDDADAQFETAKAAGATLRAEPETMFWGDRIATVSDPDGYNWSLATNVGDFDPTKAPQG